ncbi:MAG: radical SAM protein [Nitrospinota bacterium]
MSFVPYAVSWNITSRCNLACQHCYIDAGSRESGTADEIPTEKAYQILAQMAEVNPSAVLILTGGEPLARNDLFDICKRAKELGFMVVIGSNGTLLTPENVKKLKEAGVSGIGVSIDSLDDKRHDGFRGAPGALKKSIAGLTAARDAGLEVQVQTTPTKENLFEIPLIAEWAHKFGAKVFNIFFLVCTGRGQQMTDITPEEYEEVLNWALENQSEFPGMMIRPKCAPHFKRVLHEKNPQHPLLSTYIAACRAGTHYCRIDPAGKVTPCPYMDTEVGDLLTTDFATIWRDSELLNQYRKPEYDGKCGLCKYRLLCGGCRARAFAANGNAMGEDEWCVYEPKEQEEAIENIDTEAKFGIGGVLGKTEVNKDNWTKEALEVLTKIPFFARSIVEIAVDKYVKENKIKEVTPEIIRTAAPPPGRFAGNKKARKDEAPVSEIPWDEDARKRVENAPEFVRPGILKLMPIRAKERGKEKITSEFLTEIRNESMMLASKRMKKLGHGKLEMDIFKTLKDKFKDIPKKTETIEKIVELLGMRGKPNVKIISKFKDYLDDDSPKMGWTKEATARLERAPSFVRGMAKKSVEKYAKEHGYKYVTEDAINEAMENMPFAKMMKRG